MNSPIARIDLRLPGRWYGWRPGEGPRAATAGAGLSEGLSGVLTGRLR